MKNTALVSVLLLSTACVLNPRNGTELSSPSSTVSVSGYTIVPNDTISIRASASSGGTYTEITTTVSSGSPITLSDGQSYYAYSASFVVPSDYWTGDACNGAETFVRVHSTGSGYTLRTFDDLGADGQSVPDCFVDAFDATGSSIAAILSCDSPSAPTLHLTSAGAGTPFAHVGDVTIANAADITAWTCLETLDGNLTVPDSALTEVVLPVLSSVTGDVSITYPRPGLGYYENTRTTQLPALTTIGGTLAIDSPAPIASQVVTMNAGLGALTSVGDDVVVDIDTFNVSMSGLNALTTVSGDVEVITGNGDTAMYSFLGAVTSIGGSLYVDIGHSSYGVFNNLLTVGGDFAHVDGNIFPPTMGPAGYAQLVTVGGDFTFANTDVNGPGVDTMFPDLTSVGGTLTYDSIGPGSRDALYLGDTILEVEGITVTDNFALDSMGGSNIVVLNDGPITVTDNANLCTSTVNAFVAAQTGWGGVLTASGNDDGC